MRKLIIIGAGCHGRMVADIARLTENYDEICFLDDGLTGELDGIKIVGKTDTFEKYIKDCDLFVAFGNNQLRRRFFEAIKKAGGTIKTFIHPGAVISDSATIGDGVVIIAGAIVNIAAKIGDGCIINTAATVDHDCTVGKFAHISVGAHICGTVNIGECAEICAGATVIQDLNICPNATVGAGAVVIRDITEEGTYIGVPALEKGELHKSL